MTSAAKKTIHELPVRQPGDYLGPGHVVAIVPHEVEVEIRGGERARAQMALSIPYEPCVGDVLLVIGKDDEHYVIGVLHGSGQDLALLPGRRGPPRVGRPAHALERRGRGHSRAGDGDPDGQAPGVRRRRGGEARVALPARARDALNVHAGKTHTVVDDASFMTAKNASIVTEETMSINGNEIHLG